MTRERRLSLASPLDGPSCPTVEIVASTRREEARAAMATVNGLRREGVSVRDIAVVARDLDPYEEPLFRAALQYDVTPVFWTQLRVTRTRPYALIDAVCAMFAEERVGSDALFRPLEHGWVPTDGVKGRDDTDGEGGTDDDPWPVEQSAIQSAKRTLPDGPRSIADWCDEPAERSDKRDDPTEPRDESADHAVDSRVLRFVEWAAAHEVADPPPETVGELLGDVVDAYRTVGLPATQKRDSPALLETENDARAVTRVTTLVTQVERKYADWLADGTLTESWEEVRELCRLLATQRPGRREHSNARAVDAMEANDVWALSIPYVIVVGLVEGEWPQPTESVVPPELQESVLAGDGAAGIVAPRTAWGDGRDRDHFADAMRAATRGVVVTRHTRTSAGDERHPSPYLASLDLDTVPDSARQRLTSTDGALPERIAKWVATDAGATDE